MANVNDAFVKHLREVHRHEQSAASPGTPGGEHFGLSAQATANHGEYSPEICGSPKSSICESDGSTSSGGSMNPHDHNLTPPESPAQQELSTADVNIGRLSLEHDIRPRGQAQATRGRGASSSAQVTLTKRAASSDLPREPGRQSPGVKANQANRSSHAGTASKRGTPRNKRRDRHAQPVDSTRQQTNSTQCGDDTYHRPPWHDSGYGSRQATIQVLQQPSVIATTPSVPVVGTVAQTPTAITSTTPVKQRGIFTLPQKARWPAMILQPDSSPISEDQLTVEIKGIYAGLVIVEAKCINIDAAQASDPSAELGKGQWQALIALHRTLLYEHHDFLMATQHPSATLALKALPTKYSMPARMWKHGIHAFLEVLRHRRPASQDYMLSFIYLAYQMMALLYETVPIFLDTWIECLGDLARYRMAIEEEKEPHAQWGGVAASWYIKASDRHPQIGRLYHHLAILERPSLRKFACYGKSLTCVVPFPNARDSLQTLCIPIAEEAQPARPLGLLSEAACCKLHALIFLGAPDAVLEQALNSAVRFLQQPDAFRWRDCGVPLAVANIAALLGHGSHTNPLRIIFDLTIQGAIQRARPSQSTSVVNSPSIEQTTPGANGEETRRLLLMSKRLTLASLHTAARCLPGTAAFRDSLAFIGVMFCFLHFLCQAKKETQNDPELNMSLCLVFGPDDVAWADVAGFLNHLAQLYPVTARTVQSAQQGIWPEKPGEAKPLPEDFSIRGLVWAYLAFCPGWFDTDEDEDWVRTVEMAITHQTRADRALYYGLRLAFETPYLTYEPSSCTFASKVLATTHSTHSLQSLSADTTDSRSHRASTASNAQSSLTSSPPASSASDSDFVHVRRPSKPMQPQQAKTWTTVAKAASKPTKPSKPGKQRLTGGTVKVFDPEELEWEQGQA